MLSVPRHSLSFGSPAFSVSAPKNLEFRTSSQQTVTITFRIQTPSKDTLLPLTPAPQRALILSTQISALYKSFTYLLLSRFTATLGERRMVAAKLFVVSEPSIIHIDTQRDDDDIGHLCKRYTADVRALAVA